MEFTDTPAKVSIPFAEDGNRRAIPIDSQIGTTDGAASFQDGFPPLTFIPLKAGGIPPAGQDFNGILYLITQFQQWQSAGGMFSYDGNFAITIGGYPKGARVITANRVGVWVNTVDGNMSDPDAGGANWILDVIRTSIFANLTAAVNFAAGRTLIVDSVLTLTSALTIPDTVTLQFQRGGRINVNSGVTLTIQGDVFAGAYQIFGGAGTVLFTASSRACDMAVWHGAGKSAVFSQARLLTQNSSDPGGPVHAFEDNNTLNFTYPKAANFNAYAAFDANTVATGDGAYDHMVGFQARQTYSGSKEIWSRMDSFNSLQTHNGTGRVAVMRGLHAENPLGTGPIDVLAGVFIENLNRGAESYGVLSYTFNNAFRGAAGQPAQVIVQGNGQTGGLGMVVQSRGDSSALLLQTANAPLFFGTNNLFTGAVTTDGRMKIIQFGNNTATTVPDVLVGTAALEVAGANGVVTKATGGPGNSPLLAWNNDGAGNAIFANFYTDPTAALRGTIDYNRTGAVTRYNTTSDATLKELLGDAPAATSLAILDSVKLREYYWKGDVSKKPQIGPFAQELYTTYPGAVSVGGEDETGAYRAWGVDKTAFTWHLISAYQEQKKINAALSAKLESIISRLSKLESGK